MFHFGKRKSVPTYSKKWAKPSFNQTSSHQTGVTRSPNHWNTERNIHWCGFVPDIIIISENIYKLLQTNSGGLFEEANAWIKIKLVHKFLDLLDTEEWFPHWHHSIFNIKQMVSVNVSLYVFFLETQTLRFVPNLTIQVLVLDWLTFKMKQQAVRTHFIVKRHTVGDNEKVEM